MKLIVETIDDVEFISEGTGEGKQFFIEGIFMQADITNRNGRRYPMGILENEVNRYVREKIKTGRAFGELGHPEGPQINLDRASHIIVDLHREGNDFIGKAKIMNTPMGNIARNIMESGGKLGVSSRGMGSLRASGGVNEVQKDFHLATAADIVADPSAPKAFVNGILEGKEWVIVDGKIKEQTIEEYKKQFNNCKMNEFESLMITLFEDYLKKVDLKL